jgi:uncharacterized protein (DUF433 family)
VGHEIPGVSNDFHFVLVERSAIWTSGNACDAAGVPGSVASSARQRVLTGLGSKYQTRPMKLDRIRIVPGICEGRPTIRGFRITAEFVLKLLADGLSVDEIAEAYPELEREDVLQAARFGSWLAGQRTSAVA